MRSIKEIIIHCTATPEGRNVTAAEVDKWHRERGWGGIGYHFLILLDGSIQIGRPIGKPGVHCKGHNAESIGVCYVGGMSADNAQPKDTRTPKQRTALRLLIESLKRQYPKATIHGHREFAPKACPSFDVQEWLKQEQLN